MAERNFMFFNATGGFIDTAADGDSTTLGALTMGGNIDMNSAGKVIGANAATTDGDVLVYGQAGGNLAGLTIDTSNLVLSGGVTITGVPNPTSTGQVANKDYVDQLAISGGKTKEMILHESQVDNTEGVLGAVALSLQIQAVDDDRVVLTDGTTTRTYYFGTGTGDVSVTIGGTIAASMQNLATAINGDGSGVWGAAFSTDLDSIDTDGVIAIWELDNDATASEIYGTNWDAGDCQIVDYGGDYDYSQKALSDIPSSDPVSTNFGFRRTQASLSAGEMHYTENNDVVYAWDDDADVWNAMNGSASIVDATGASGGGVKGKATYDTDYGLAVSTGIVSMNITADKGLHFNSGALEIELASANELSADANGLNVEGVPTLFNIGATAVGATVTSPNLDTLTDASNADSLHTHAHSATTGRTENDHHDRLHVIDSTSDHSVSGESVGNVLTITGTGDTFAWASPGDVESAERIENFSVALEGLTKADPVYVSTTSGKVGKALANTDAKARVIGLAVTTEIADAAIEVIEEGIFEGALVGATPGDEYWLNAAGGLVVDPPAGNVRAFFIGVAHTATDLWLQLQDHGKKPA